MKTKTPRKPRKSTDVSYSVLFPGGRNQDLGYNQKARVAGGDRRVNETVANDYNSMYSPRKKAKVVSDGSGGTKVIIHKD